MKISIGFRVHKTKQTRAARAPEVRRGARQGVVRCLDQMPVRAVGLRRFADRLESGFVHVDGGHGVLPLVVHAARDGAASWNFMP